MALFSAQVLARLEANAAMVVPTHTILVVDDKDANLSVMSTILRPHYRLLEARDGQEALALIDGLAAHDAPACIISDDRMPRLSGVKMLAQVRERLPMTPRIIVSGFIDVEAVIDAINQAEIFHFIVKPFDAGEFLNVVERAVALYARRHEERAYRGELERKLGLLEADAAALASASASAPQWTAPPA